MSQGAWKKNDYANTTQGLKGTLKKAAAIGARPFCPVTGNIPTRMAQASFEKICNRYQADETKPYCHQVCRGQVLPAGLEFIETSTLILEVQTMKAKPGICALCGEKKNVRTVREKQCCSTCEFIWRGAHISPELMAKTLLEVQGKTWVENYFKVSIVEMADSLAVEIRDTGKVLAADLQQLQKEIRIREQDLEKVREENHKNHCAIAKELGYDAADQFDYVTEISLLKQENDGLRDQLIRDTGKNMNLTCSALAGEIGQVITRDSVILDLALDTLAGRISGITADKLQALRLAA